MGIGNIIRMDRDGKNREVYAWGIRKSVGMDFNPKDKTLWFTDNRVDGMGRIFRRASSTARTSPVRISLPVLRRVPEEISGRHLLGAARLLEPYRSGRRSRDVDLPQRGRHGGKSRSRKARSTRRRIFGSAGGRRSTEGRLHPGVGRLRRRALSDLVRRQIEVQIGPIFPVIGAALDWRGAVICSPYS
jgi:hypothetical protein